MSADVVAALAAMTGGPVREARTVAGGDVSRALRVRLGDGREVFVKHGADAPETGQAARPRGGQWPALIGSDVYRAEADGLAWLAAAEALPVPAIVATGGEPAPFLALEWVASAPRAPDHAERLGRGLARLHRAGARAFGLDGDNYLGSVPVHNAPLPTWPAFYAERRLLPLARRAVDAGRLDAAAGRAVERVAARLPELAGPPEPPARLHGDLWSGNAMTGPDGGPVLVDPAVLGGHREVDLAMMRLFGGFAGAVFAAYAEEHPLAEGHAERVELWQLLPLLIHAILFGGSYGTRVARVAARYA